MRFAGLISLLFILSCKQTIDYSKEISRLDSAANVLAAAEQILRSADTVFWKKILDSTGMNLNRISGIIKHDTLNKKMAMFLTSAYDHSGNILNFLENRNHLERAVIESKKRMNDLKHDLAENLIEQNKSAAYIVNEVHTVGKISDMIKSSVTNAAVASAKLDSMKTQIAFIADSLNLRTTK